LVVLNKYVNLTVNKGVLLMIICFNNSIL